MKVLIQKCSGENFWYKNMVNQEVEVKEIGSQFVLKEDFDKGSGKTWRYLKKEDCRVISDEGKKTTKVLL